MSGAAHQIQALIPKLHTAMALVNDIVDTLEGIDRDAFVDPTVRAMLSPLDRLDPTSEALADAFAAVCGACVIEGVGVSPAKAVTA